VFVIDEQRLSRGGAGVARGWRRRPPFGVG
jgi:hypothetical protein